MRSTQQDPQEGEGGKGVGAEGEQSTGRSAAAGVLDADEVYKQSA